MTGRIADVSPSFTARLAAVFYLLDILTGGLAVFLRGKLGLAALLIASASYVVVTILFYRLFKPVNTAVSLLAAIFSLAGCVNSALAALHLPALPINSLVFFGFYCLLIGFLILRSTFLPRVLGVLMALSGVGWLTFLSPSFAKSLTPYNMAPGIFGELILTLWLLVMGVNVQRWNEQAGGTRSTGS